MAVVFRLAFSYKISEAYGGSRLTMLTLALAVCYLWAKSKSYL